MPFRLHVSGRFACFPRPEFANDRVSYDVITPIAARRILEAIYWRREIRWRVDAIHVLKPIHFGLASSADAPPLEKFGGSDSRSHAGVESGGRQVALLDPAYAIDARFELASAEGNSAQHTKMFAKAVRQGRYFRQPYLGLREYPATVALLDEEAPFPPAICQEIEDRDLGWMIHDLSLTDGAPCFFRARMTDGRIRVPAPGSAELFR
jgi:CRISPR-associated protein Cas5d